ncbi:MAG: DUF4389 domain-containing protein [Alphaproteobacteria bacterium]
MASESREHLASKDTWIRLLYMVLFAVAFYLLQFIVAAVAVLQFLLTLLTGASNQRLSTLGRELGSYLKEIVEFVTYGAERRPFPFSDWPSVAREADADQPLA